MWNWGLRVNGWILNILHGLHNQQEPGFGNKNIFFCKFLKSEVYFEIFIFLFKFRFICPSRKKKKERKRKKERLTETKK